MIKIASILTDIKYGETEPLVSVLINTADTKEMRIVFKEGQKMKEHKAPYPIVVEVFDGLIDFGVSAENFILEKGMMIALDAKIPHDLRALQNSILRLSLNKSDSIQRPEQAINS